MNANDNLPKKSSHNNPKDKEHVDSSKKSFDIFKLLLHNNSTTPMHFVVQVLKSVFHCPPAEAYALMFEAHTYGVVVLGFFPQDIADSYINNVHAIASYHGHTLHCSKVAINA